MRRGSRLRKKSCRAEPLEQRMLFSGEIGSVTGRVFHDAAADGIFDAADQPFPSATVFVDLNQNGAADPGEPATNPESTGLYQLALPAGTYTLRAAFPVGWRYSLPLSETRQVTVQAGITATDNDFVAYTTGQIRGTVFNDADGDGVRDAGEAGLAGRTVYVDRDGDAIVDADEPIGTTDASGNYQLDEFPGTYRVRQVLPLNWGQTSPAGDAAQWAIVRSWSVSGNINFGSQSGVSGGRAAGFVWEDTDGNGEQDPGELPAAGWQVTISGNSRTISGLTGDDGRFVVPGLPAGQYTATVADKAGWLVENWAILFVRAGDTVTGHFGVTHGSIIQGSVSEDRNGNGTIEAHEAFANVTVYADLNGNGAADPGEPSDQTDAIGRYQIGRLAPGTYALRVATPVGYVTSSPSERIRVETVGTNEHLVLRDFNLALTAGRITGRLYEDANKSGTLDAGEKPYFLANWQVYLDLNNDGGWSIGEPLQTVNRDGDGYYEFTGLSAGPYVVRAITPDHWQAAVPADAARNVVTEAGRSTDSVDFGFTGVPNVIVGSVFQDFDHDGVRDAGEPGMAGRIIWADDNQNSRLDAGEATATTASDGTYSFDSFSPGTTHYVMPAPVTGWVTTNFNGAMVTTDANRTTVMSAFGVAPGPLVRLTLINDYNADGVMNGNDPVFLQTGWEFYVDANDSGAPDPGEQRAAVDPSTGTAIFGGLPTGSYTFRLVPRAGYRQTGPAGEAFRVSLNGGTVTGSRFFATAQGKLTGTIYADNDHDGARGPGEPGLTGWDVVLDTDGDGLAGASEPRALTDAAGKYAFDNLTPGTYSVLVPPQTDWTAASVSAGQLVAVGFGQVAVVDLGFQSPPPVLGPPATTAVGPESGPAQPISWDLGSFTAGASTGPWAIAVDWGDGTSATSTIMDAPGALVLPHAYQDQGLYTASVEVRSAKGSTARTTVPITIVNVSPVATFAAGPAVSLGQPSGVLFSNPADPSPADVAAGLRYSFDFNNDGDFADPGDVIDSASPSASFTFGAAGAFTVHGRIADKDGGATDYTTAVSVNLAPPAVVSSRDLRSAADARVQDGTSTSTNFGTATELQVRKSTTVGASRESYLRFSLTGGPAGATIQSGLLRLFARSSSAGSVTIDLYAVAGTTWSETGITWNTRPPIGAKIGSRTVASTTGTWIEFDVSAYVKQQRIAGATAVAFALRSPTVSTPYAAMPSDEAAANRPVLRLTESSPPAVVLSASTVNVVEGSAAGTSLTVRLSGPPSASTTVTITRTSGDTDLSAALTSLTFTAANWNIPQTVKLRASEDVDTTNGVATFTFSAAGFTGGKLTATEIDNDVPKVLRATADSFVGDGTSAGSNFGTATTLAVRKASTAGNTRWTLLKFSLASLTSISSATLRLFGRLDSTAAPSMQVQAFAASSTTWTETGVTWNNKPLTSGSALGTLTVAGTTGKWYALDLTAWLTAQKAAGMTNVSLVLTAPLASSAAALFSSDEAAANRPELVVKS